MCETSNEKHVYSLVAEPVAGTTGTGLDQLVSYVFADPGLAGETDSKDILVGADAADRLNHFILDAAAAASPEGAAADGVFTVAEVIAMNAWIRADAARLQLWTDLHGDDEDTYETGLSPGPERRRTLRIPGRQPARHGDRRRLSHGLRNLRRPFPQRGRRSQCHRRTGCRLADRVLCRSLLHRHGPRPPDRRHPGRPGAATATSPTPRSPPAPMPPTA